jgi:perosamine synthetase
VHMRTDHYTCFGAGPADLPGVEEFERTQLCIPSGWWVSNEDREYVVDAIRRGW